MSMECTTRWHRSVSWVRTGLFAAALVVSLIALFMPTRAFADIAGGTCGTSAWSISDDGVLTIGSGTLDSNADEEGNPKTDFWPWYGYREKITSVVFESGAKGNGSASSMFYGCTNLTTVDAANWDTSAVTDLSNLFYGCAKLTALDASSWKTSSVKSLSGMFSGCTALETLTTTGWNTAAVTNMSNLFLGCTKLAALDLSGWNTSAVTDMSTVFSGCTALADLNISGWKTPAVTTMQGLFTGCTKLTSLDVSGWNTSNVTNMNALFSGCTGLTSLNVSGWKTSKVTDMQAVFTGCTGLTSLDVSSWDTSAVTTINGMFSGCTGLTSLNLSGWKTSAITNMQLAFSTCTGLTSLNLSGWDTSGVTSMDSLFSGLTSLTTLNVSGWKTQNVTNMQTMFTSCSSLKSLDLSSWDTSKVTNMRGMFGNCAKLTTLKIAGWNTSAVTNMSGMFANCAKLTSLDLSSWDTSAVTTMAAMFSLCSNLETLNVKGWNTAAVTSMTAMFAYCSDLKALDLSSWDTAAVVQASTTAGTSGTTSSQVSNMFSQCEELGSFTVGTSYVFTSDTSDLVPEPISEDEKWWSTADKAWYTKAQIVANRSGKADTYLSEPVVETYTITWKNYNGTVLETDTNVAAGITPTYDGATPTKPSTSEYVYTFSGWDPKVVAVTGDATYTAQFTETPITKTYTITWKNYDGSILEVDENVSAGTVPTYNGAMPTRPATSEYTYTFSGWNPTVAGATADATYTAQFTATPIATASWKRLAGDGRYDTMKAIVSEGFTSCNTAVLVTGANFPDALSASALAGAYNCPVILTAAGSLSAQAKSELTRLGVTKVYIVGGEGSVSKAVATEVAKSASVERIAGSSRQGTSLAVLEKIAAGNKVDKLVVCSGIKKKGKDGKETNFADALSIGPWCYANSAPILLTGNDGKLTKDQVSTLTKLGVGRLVIVGGTGAVSDDVPGQLGKGSGDYERLAGDDRYATSAAVADWELAHGMTCASVSVATGASFPDALAGAALCGSKNSVLVLAKNEKSSGLDVIAANKAQVQTGYVLGGESSVSASLYSYLESLTK